MRKYIYFSFLACALAHGSSAATAAATTTPTSVPAPCSTDGMNGLRLCSDFLSITPAATSGLSPSMLELVNDRVQQQINGFYQGYDLDPTSGGNPPGTPFGPPVCDLGVGEITNALSQNGGASCGSPAQIQVTMNVPTTAGCATGSPTFSTVANMVGGNGTLEYGYLRGGVIEAIQFYQNQVLRNEILGGSSLNITSGGGCVAAATQFQASYTSEMSALSQVRTALGGSTVNLNSALGCPVASFSASPSATPSASPSYLPVANACQLTPTSIEQISSALCGARTDIESAYTQLAVCEIFYRAQTSFTTNVGSTAAQTAIFNQVASDLDSTCESQCQSSISYSACNLPSNSVISQCVQTCYNNSIAQEMTKILEGFWPQTSPPGAVTNPLPAFVPGTSSMNSITQSKKFADSSTLPLWFLSVGALGKRKKRKHAVKAQKWISFFSILLVIACLIISGCSSKKGSTAVQMNGTQAVASVVPGTNSINGANIAIGVDLNAATTDLTNAMSFLSSALAALPSSCVSGVPTTAASAGPSPVVPNPVKAPTR